VQHSSLLPRTDRVYRCPICRLNMTFDVVKLKMLPIPSNHDNNKKKRKTA
jgi:hypothetical protein